MNTSIPISDKQEESKELSVEEIKSLRLCRCGNWKRSSHSKCGHCFLLFETDNEKWGAFIEDVRKAKSGEISPRELFRHVDHLEVDRSMVILDLMLRLRIRVDPEDYSYIKTQKEKADKKRLFFKGERQQVARVLGQATKCYNGYNTAP